MTYEQFKRSAVPHLDLLTAMKKVEGGFELAALGSCVHITHGGHRVSVTCSHVAKPDCVYFTNPKQLPKPRIPEGQHPVREAVPLLARDEEHDLAILDTTERDQSTIFQGRAAPSPSVEVEFVVEWPTGRKESAPMVLGARAIAESIAYLVQQELQVSPADPAARIPMFPYRVLECLYEFVVGKPPTNRFVPAALGTLALLGLHPGPAMMFILKLFREEAARGRSETEALARVWQTYCPHVHDAVDVILRTDLPELVAMHRDRGLMEGSLTYLSGLFERALRLRLRAPFHDLASVMGGGVQGLAALQKMFPSCDVLQERRYPGEEVLIDEDLLLRNQIYCLDPAPPDSSGFTHTTFTRTFQSQQVLLYSHLDEDSGVFLDSTEVRCSCPFYSACGLPFRKAPAPGCRSDAWQSFQGIGLGCYFSVAVAASMGTVVTRSALMVP